MFKKLFGNGNAPAASKTQAQAVDIGAATEKLQN